MDDSELGKLLERVKDASSDETTSVEDVLEALGHRSFGPVLFIVGLFALSPIGAIPGASLISAALIVLVAMQLVWGAGYIWLPNRLCAVEVKSSKIANAVDWLHGPLGYLSLIARPRFKRAFADPMPRLVAVATILLAAAMVPLAVVPGGVAPVAALVMLIGLAFVARDGALLAAALVLSVVALVVTFYVLT
ncbi:MAG: exopolysaccharide biosynthesis protein [Pseudomonadota bacterium]